ncbi:MAG: acyl-CoA synthetase [Anaerolineae bacterium]
MTITLIDRAAQYSGRIAIIDDTGEYPYHRLLSESGCVARHLLNGAADLREARVAFLAPPGFDYARVQWGIWRAGGIAVPLAVSHPPPELEYVIADSGAAVVVAHPDFADRLRPIAAAQGRRFLLTDELTGPPAEALPDVSPARRAMIVYTSGTTGKPKGVVTTHFNIQAMVTTLVQAWGWQPDDHILHVLPLHHVHGIVNVLTCALWSGAVCEFLPKFQPDAVWARFIERPLTLFMAVPTIYARLIAAWQAAPPEAQAQLSAACRKLRLMVSGSAALPVSVLEQWRHISGHTLLERYGMTEIGMALSNPLHGERRPGFVGAPLPGVSLRLVNEQGQVINTDDIPGEIQVQGPMVFKEYWQRPQATHAAFAAGWFRTGDTALRNRGSYRILGRNSVDIIKTAGYKVSALEIEETLRQHPAIGECAVIGVPDADLGQRVCAAIVAAPGAPPPGFDSLRDWAAARLAPYKVPRQFALLDALPRNAMGKVTKPALHPLFEASEGEGG